MTKTFIQITDSHIDDDKLIMGVDSQANLSAIVSVISQKNYDALLISGDLAHNGTLESYQILQKILDPIATEIYVLPGNHDDLSNLSQVFNKSYLCNFTIDCWEVITIDSVQAGKVSGRLSNEQLHSLSQELRSSSAKYIVLCLHHPPVSMQSDWDDEMSLENPEDLFAVIDQYDNIKAVMWGHAHQSSEFNRNGVKLFSCPSTALQFNGSSSIGYNHYTLNDNGEIYCKTQWL
ncbi:metallophosphoesterase [Candidatus Thioglobus sp.]|nr:metallophosphoesterase [Candidatus Thioglobus sp.]